LGLLNINNATADIRDMQEQSTQTIYERLVTWGHRIRLGRKLAVFLAAVVLISCFVTYVVLSSNPPLGPDPKTVIILLYINLVLLLIFGALVAKQIVSLWQKKKQGLAGSGLHVKLVVLFSLISVVPVIIVATFSVIFFNMGIEKWFNTRVQTAISESSAVADSYLREHKNAIQGDALAMASDINRYWFRLIRNQELLNDFIQKQAMIRAFPEAMIFTKDNYILGSSRIIWSLDVQSVTEDILAEADDKGIVLITNDGEDHVKAVVKLDNLVSTYLYVGRYVNPSVIEHLKRTQEAVSAYEQLKGQSSDVEIMFALVFIVVALLFLLAAVFVGLRFATNLVRPITELIGAAERVSDGDFTAQVSHIDKEDALGILSRTFNKMIKELEDQRQELVIKNQILDSRRRFTEAVLESVSAGVIGLDRDDGIYLPNKMASKLLHENLYDRVGDSLVDIVPEMRELLAKAQQDNQSPITEQIKLLRGGEFRTFNVTIVSERTELPDKQEHVITFDDITDFLAAQRQAAWADIARRIAHEIKNPLTPIQLSAERLRRKYLKHIKEIETDTFTLCIDTIIRQVDDIRCLVDEFSSFARMPAPVFSLNNIVSICKEIIFLQSSANPDIEFIFEVEDDEITFEFDPQQIRQAIQNIIKNAILAIKTVQDRFAGVASKKEYAKVRVVVKDYDGKLAIDIEDNGPGFPKTGREQLVEPYVTFHPEGSGLGLAIVRKILEDHNGELLLDDSELGGAKVRMILVAPEDKVTELQLQSAVHHGT
jgi:two-component system, NtrC family, nitrogen regulation sensor histidine kinase NtrY